ncbi:MAG: S8 family serine peptidase [Desulfobacterales bacterium]|nr:S8 family serine peptidase [Desulfobacterales bacterium]
MIFILVYCSSIGISADRNITRLLVGFKQPVDLNKILHKVTPLTTKSFYNEKLYCLDIHTNNLESIISQMTSDPMVAFVEIDRSWFITTENNKGKAILEKQAMPEWLDIIQADRLNELDLGRKVLVAILDTGIDLENRYFQDHVSVNPLESVKDGIDNDANGFIDDIYGWNFGDNTSTTQDILGHGTHVTSILLATFNHCKVLPIKINSGGNFEFKTSALVEALNYAMLMGAKVINMSLTLSEYSESVHFAIKTAYESGIVLVAAVGNNSNQIAYPAKLEEVIAVGSLYSATELAYWFSPSGEEIDITAPGVKIDVIEIGGDAFYATGTSMSAPMVSGAIAALLDMNPHLKPQTIRNLLSDSARDLGTPGEDDMFGAGALDCTQLQKIALPMLTLPTTPFYCYSKKIPIDIEYFLPRFDTDVYIYIGLKKDELIWLLLPEGTWQLASEVQNGYVGFLQNYDQSTKGFLFGNQGIFPPLILSQWMTGNYLLGMAVVDAYGQYLAPISWSYVNIF